MCWGYQTAFVIWGAVFHVHSYSGCPVGLSSRRETRPMGEGVARENSPHFATPPLVSQGNDIWEISMEIPCWCDDASLPRSRYCFWLAEANFPRGMTNQKHYPDLDSNTSSVWNFCARFSDVISWGNPVVASANVGCFLRLVKVQKNDSVWTGVIFPRFPQHFRSASCLPFKRSSKATLLDILQTEDSYIDVDTIIMKMKK